METAPLPRLISWQKVLLLCIPGLVVAFLLRFWLLSAIPEAYYGPDGGSYWHTAVRLWTEGKLSMMDKRRWLYPAFLCLLPILPTSPIHAVAFLQHLLGVGMVFFGGMITSRCTRRPFIWVPLVAVVLASWPQSLWLEHSLETETCLVAMFMIVVWTGLSPGKTYSPRRLFWFLLAAALVAAWKPHGRGIWLACVLIAFWKNGNPLRWAVRSWAALILALIIILSSGSSGQGNWLLLNSVLPLVPLEGKAFPVERASLRPLLLEALSVKENYAWEQEKFKYRLNSHDPSVVSESWAATTRDGKRFSKVCRTFALEALRANPLAFGRFTLQKVAISLSENGYSNRLEPKKFWSAQDEENAARLKKLPLKEMTLLYRRDVDGYQKLSQNGVQKHNRAAPIIRRISQGWGWFQEDFTPPTNTLHLRLAGWLALAGLLCCWLPGNVRRLAILWLPAAFYAITVYAVGDRVGRYAYPLNWLGVILIAVAFDQLLSWVLRDKTSVSPPLAAASSDDSRKSETNSPA